jgi:hypothetical protein
MQTVDLSYGSLFDSSDSSVSSDSVYWFGIVSWYAFVPLVSNTTTGRFNCTYIIALCINFSSDVSIMCVCVCVCVYIYIYMHACIYKESETS